MFFRQLAIILRSGISLLRGLELLQQRVDGKMALLCHRLQAHLYSGSSLTAAMQGEKAFFSPLAISLTAAGEASGELVFIFEQLADYYTDKEQMRNFIIKALLYPCFLLFCSVCVMLIFLLYILPVLGSTYISMGIKPQGLLALLLELQEILLYYWPLFALLAVIILLLLYALGKYGRIYLRNSLGRKNFYHILQEVNFCKLLALLLESGMSITKAVTIIIGTVESSTYKQQLLLLNSRLKRGIDISDAAGAVKGVFSPLTLDLLCIGAVSGYLPQMLKEAARIGEEDLRENLERIKEFLAPLLLLVAAVVIAAVVCVVLGPLFEMLSAMPEYS